MGQILAPVGLSEVCVVVISGLYHVAPDKEGTIHLKDAQTLLLCLDTVLLMHGLTMHAGRHNQGIEGNFLWFFAQVQAWLPWEFQPHCAPPATGTFYTNGLQVCNWHMCTDCRGCRGMDMDTWELLSQEVDYTGDWDWDGWVIMKVPRFAGFVGGLFHGQSFYLYTLW